MPGEADTGITLGEPAPWIFGGEESGAAWMALANDWLISFCVPHSRRNRTVLSRPRKSGKCAAVANKI